MIFFTRELAENTSVTDEELELVYEEMKTPYKWGPVLKEEGYLIDCPTIFKKDKVWYMMYTAICTKEEPQGYDTYLACSKDLLHWTKMGKVISRTGTGWDGAQRDGGFALMDTNWNGTHELYSYEGEYWATYIGGDKSGYETPPLSIGLAHTVDPTKVTEWSTEDHPVLSVDDKDIRWFEKYTLFKSFVFRDETNSFGYPFVMFYNCKGEETMTEKIGIAVSNNMRQWERLGENPVIDNSDLPGNFISGDPQIYRMGDLWVMNYFVASVLNDEYTEFTAYDTFAVSKDLFNWKKWTGSPLVEPSEEWDNMFAHKPFVLKEDGIIYHFYCACNQKGERFIALATSKDLRER